MEQNIEPINIIPIPTATDPIPMVTGPGVIVLQWLTYAFWGLTALAISILAGNVIAYFMEPSTNSDFTAYATAAVLVLLPISVVCDLFYSKHEPIKKTGASSIIMVVHSVLFALFGIGALVALVFSLVQLMISGSDTTGTRIALYSEIIVLALYALAFLRALLPAKLVKFRKYYLIIMVITASVVSVLSFVGPISNLQSTRNDRLIDSNIDSVRNSIDNYVSNQNKLPDSLANIDLSGDSKTLIDKNLVQYIPNSQPSVTTPSTFNPKNSSTTYYYELCVNYKQAGTNNDRYAQPLSQSGDGYSSYIIADNHPAGAYCYKLSSTPMYLTK